MILECMFTYQFDLKLQSNALSHEYLYACINGILKSRYGFHDFIAHAADYYVCWSPHHIFGVVCLEVMFFNFVISSSKELKERRLAFRHTKAYRKKFCEFWSSNLNANFFEYCVVQRDIIHITDSNNIENILR